MFYEGRKVLVTGGSGFVGIHIVQELLKQGAHVRVPLHERPMPMELEGVETMEADLTNAGDCQRVMDGVDYVFHAAGSVAAAGVTVTNPMSAITGNLILTARVLEAVMSSKAKGILIFSSGVTAYPQTEHAVKEDEMWTAPPPDIYFGYGWMRRYLELMGEFVAQKSEMGVAICRPTAVYGRFDNFDPKRSHFIPALIRRAVEKEDPYVVWGTGEEMRDILHVTDLARGCLLLLEKHAKCDPVNIGYGQATKVREVVEIILKASGHDGAKVEFDATKPTTIPVRMVDTSKAKSLLGFESSVSLEEGIADMIGWYRETIG